MEFTKIKLKKILAFALAISFILGMSPIAYTATTASATETFEPWQEKTWSGSGNVIYNMPLVNNESVTSTGGNVLEHTRDIDYEGTTLGRGIDFITINYSDRAEITVLERFLKTLSNGVHYFVTEQSSSGPGGMGGGGTSTIYLKLTVTQSPGSSVIPPGSSTPPTGNAFTDISHHAPRTQMAISWAQERGYVTGSGGKFYPDDNMTRASFALVMWRYAGRPSVPSSTGFSDVPRNHIAHNAIQWAQQNGIVTGSGGRFFPDDNMSRASMILMLHRYNNLRNGDRTFRANALDTFTDKGEIPNVARNAMLWGVSNGLITGANNRLYPNDNITRASVVLILYRYHTNF